jgi:hypothetical protein
MPLFDGYGVLVGKLSRYACDRRQDDFHYYHCTLTVRSPDGMFRCAVDLDSKHRRDGLQWKIVELPPEVSRDVSALEDGWHDLANHERSGALDYYRSPVLAPCAECIHASQLEGDGDPEIKKVTWRYGTGQHAFHDLEPLLMSSRRIFVYGEPFRIGKGVHNIHQNQGDPHGSRWASENAPWQDGAVMVERHDGRVVAFLCKFSTQRFCIEAAHSGPSDVPGVLPPDQHQD